MSDGRPARGIVLAHGSLAHGLVDAVQRITGAAPDVLTPISNRGLSPEALSAEIRQRMEAGPVVVFTDLPSGSCNFAARRLCQGQDGIEVVSGVNLPILLDFVLNRELPLVELAGRLVEKGRAGICCNAGDQESYGGRALSGR